MTQKRLRATLSRPVYSEKLLLNIFLWKACFFSVIYSCLCNQTVCFGYHLSILLHPHFISLMNVNSFFLKSFVDTTSSTNHSISLPSSHQNSYRLCIILSYLTFSPQLIPVRLSFLLTLYWNGFSQSHSDLSFAKTSD